MRLILLLSGLLISANAFPRSGGAGNGGDAIVCPDRVILLDSYEAQKMRLTIDLNNPNVQTPTWRSMVNVAVKRLEKFDQVTASLLYDYAMELVNDFEKFQMYPGSRGQHVYIGKDIIAEINDSEHVSTPEGCEEHPRQLVSQRVPRFRKEFRYEFSQSLWEKMSLQEQSMTILHEAWYRIMLENGADNSRATRYINGLVASRDFEEYSFTEYIEELKNTELRYYIVPNVSGAIKDKEIKFDLQNHQLDEVDGMICAPNFKLNPSIKQTYKLIFNTSQRYLKNLKFQQVCFENSRISKLVLPTIVPNKERTLRLPFHQVQFGKSLNDTPTIHFSKKGKLSHFSGIKHKLVMEMFYRCNGEVSFLERHGCQEGPFIYHSTKIENPTDILFDDNEIPISHFRR